MRRISSRSMARRAWAGHVAVITLAGACFLPVSAASATETTDTPEASAPDTTQTATAEATAPATEETTTAEPKPTATSSPKPTSTPKPTATSTPKPTATSTPKPTGTATPEPSTTSSPEPTDTPSPEPTTASDPDPVPSATPTPTTDEAQEDDDEASPPLSVLYASPTVWKAEPVRTTFRDVSAADAGGVSALQAEAIAWLARLGAGFGWGLAEDSATFSPTAPATRADLAAFAYRAAGLPLHVMDEDGPYDDVDADHASATEVSWLASRGVELDDDTSSFDPDRATTRGEVALTLHRLAGERRIVFVPGLSFEPVEAPSEHETSTEWLESLGVAAPGSDAEAAAEELTKADLAALLYEVVDAGLVLSHEPSLTERLDFSGSEVPSLAGLRNGTLTSAVLCAVPWDADQTLSCHAAADLETLNAAFSERFGVDIPITDSYRSLSGQRVAKATKGVMAATPGTSQHGWGAAIDLNSGGLPGGFRGGAYRWLVDQAPAYGWELPAWARPGGPKPEPWHLEHRG